MDRARPEAASAAFQTDAPVRAVFAPPRTATPENAPGTVPNCKAVRTFFTGIKAVRKRCDDGTLTVVHDYAAQPRSAYEGQHD